MRPTICLRVCAFALMLFAFDPRVVGQSAPVVKTVYSFTGKGKDVALFHAGLVQGKDGNFYGATNVLGAGDFGEVFKITPAGVRTVLYRFTANGANGAEPCDGLVADSHGNFYGTTDYGGGSGSGTVFKITPRGVLTTLHNFTGIGFAGGSADGALPHAGLVQGRDGNFYGTTMSGGSTGDGTVFRITPAGTLTTLHSFADNRREGILPYAGLVQGSDGNFYGETGFGGVRGGGTVFEITPAGALTTLRSFSRYGAGGSALIDDLAPGSDGNLYGTALSGGRWDNGATFRITPEGLNRR